MVTAIIAIEKKQGLSYPVLTKKTSQITILISNQLPT